MTRDEIRSAVLDVLHGIAPEIVPASLDPTVEWRDQLDVDSVDLLNFVLGIHRALGVEIPETDYPALSSLDGCVTYLAAKLGA